MKHLPNFITCLNLLTGAAGIVLVLKSDLQVGLFCVLIAGVFDFLDGLVARLLGVSSPIGRELDSLADVISFGLLPAVFMMVLMGEYISGYWSFLGLAMVVFSALRLAKFNIDENQTDKFIGLPTPANAIMITSLILVPASWISFNVLALVTLLSCWLLVSPIVMMALKFKSYGWKGNEMKYLLIVFIIISSFVLGMKVLPLIIPVYILFSIIGNYVFRAGV